MARLPMPGGEQRDETKFIVFENFEKMNTQSVRQSLSEKDLAWLENLQPIAGNNLVTVPAPAAAATTITGTISTMFYVDINGVDYFIAFTVAGSGYAITISTGSVNHFALDGTFSAQPDVTTWQATRLLIADSKAGYSTFDGSLYAAQGGVSPNITVTNGGSGYSTAPPVTISGGSGHGATAHSVIQNGVVISVVLDTPGTGYQATDTLTVTFGTGAGSGAAGHVTMTGFTVSGFSIAEPGQWTGSPGSGTVAVSFTGGGGGGAAGTATIGPSPHGGGFGVVGVTLTNPGSGYTSTPSCTLSVTGVIIQPLFNTFLNPEQVASIVLDSGGAAYVAPPIVTLQGGSPSVAATAHATESGGAVTSLVLDTPGSGYSGPPMVIIGTGSGAAASAHVWPFINSSNAAYAFTTVAVFQGRVWLGGGPLLTWTGTGASYGDIGYDDFLSADASGSLLISDADLIHAITALRSLNNYLFIMGDQSVKQIGNISLDGTGKVTLFTILTLSSDQGTIYPKSCISYNRVFMFANTNGIYGVFGSSVQKLSSDMDGIFKLVDFTQPPQGALVDINAIHNAIFLVRYKDPLSTTRSILLTFDGKKWFVTSQGGLLTAIATSASLATGQNSLYGSSGPDVTKLFADATIAVTFKMQSALTHHGNAVQRKKAIRAGFAAALATGTGNVTMAVESENGPQNYTIGLVAGFQTPYKSSESSGKYLGQTLTGTLAGFTVTNMITEYQESALWG